MADHIHFFQRPFPNANMVLVAGPRPILIDTGFGADLPETELLLREAGVPPGSLHLIANTHCHCDHVGGNHGLQTRYGIPVVASAAEAGPINARHPAACDAHFLGQPVEAFHVDQTLTEGDVLETGEVTLQVIATPGHTPGHLSFYAPEERVLILGDVIQWDNVAWLNLCADGPDPLEQMLTTLDRLAALPVAWACSGHGPRIDDFPAALAAARRRYEKWRAEPEKIGWHACKRALMLEGGMTPERVEEYLLESVWFQQFSRRVFRVEPEAFIQSLAAEMLRAGAAGWQEGRLVSLTPYRPLPAGWLRPELQPHLWDQG